MQRELYPRKRCSECRRWYRPSARAADNQMTCGRDACRKRRHAKLVRLGRSRSLQDSRFDERDRQRECRKREHERGSLSPPGRRAEGASPEGACRPEAQVAMSLTGFVLEPTDFTDVTAKYWDKLLQGMDEMSLMGFRRQLLDICKEIDHKLGQVGQETPHVTDELILATSCNCAGKGLPFETGCH